MNPLTQAAGLTSRPAQYAQRLPTGAPPVAKCAIGQLMILTKLALGEFTGFVLGHQLAPVILTAAAFCLHGLGHRYVLLLLNDRTTVPVSHGLGKIGLE